MVLNALPYLITLPLKDYEALKSKALELDADTLARKNEVIYDLRRKLMASEEALELERALNSPFKTVLQLLKNFLGI